MSIMALTMSVLKLSDMLHEVLLYYCCLISIMGHHKNYSSIVDNLHFTNEYTWPKLHINILNPFQKLDNAPFMPTCLSDEEILWPR